MRILIFLFILVCFAYHGVYSQNPVDIHGQLAITGSKFVNQHGDTVSFAGPSLFWSNSGWGGEKYYKSEVVSWVKNDWGATIIRAAMGVDDNGGYLTYAANKTRVKTIVDAAIAEGIYVIIDWHSHHAEDYRSQAQTFFTEMAETYGDYPNVLYEIYNEPLNVSWNNVVKPYADSVIRVIREIDEDNIIIVGSPNWCQRIDTVANNPIAKYENIAYSMHFYAGTHTQWLRDRTQNAINKGIPIIVSEWGSVLADGSGSVAFTETNTWIEFMRTNKLTHCNWSINDKAEGASALKYGASTTGNWKATNLTASGTLAREIIKNWENSYVSIDDVNDAEIAVLYTQANNTIGIEPRTNELLHITVYDITGQIIVLESTDTFIEISTANLSHGVYVLKISTNSNSQTFKFVR